MAAARNTIRSGKKPGKKPVNSLAALRAKTADGYKAAMARNAARTGRAARADKVDSARVYHREDLPEDDGKDLPQIRTINADEFADNDCTTRALLRLHAPRDDEDCDDTPPVRLYAVQSLTEGGFDLFSWEDFGNDIHFIGHIKTKAL